MKITKLPSHTDKINTLQDIYKYLKIKEEDVLIFKNPKSTFEKYINACAIIPLIVKVYNNGWIPDFNDYTQLKYLPSFKKVGSGWVFYGAVSWLSGASGPSGHHYKKSDDCREACTKFVDVYNDFYNG